VKQFTAWKMKHKLAQVIEVDPNGRTFWRLC
jgi:hypothetical protein